MHYNALSVNIECFSHNSSGNCYFIDKYDLLKNIKDTEQHFLYRTIDIGPYEVFQNFNMLLALVKAINKIDFRIRLLTSGKYFRNIQETINQFAELFKFGVDMIMLRLDDDILKSITEEEVMIFLSACGVGGKHAFMTFEISDQVPDSLYKLLRFVEDKRFYNEIFFKAKNTHNQVEASQVIPIDWSHYKDYRIAISADGNVTLRTNLIKGPAEIHLGNLSTMSLSEIISPNKLFAPVEEVLI